jgi:glycosyltransferase involved in cell wall biosynthesis
MHFTSLKKEDVLIIHDPFHFWPVAWHKNTVVISHGVRWDRPDKSENMYNRAHLASAKFSMKYAKKIVANDTNFYRKLGYRLKPKEKMFAQVDKNRWFIPNCVDTNIFKKVKPYSSLVKLNTILVPRNIVPGRGIHLAISAFSRFHKKYENTLLVIC